MSRRGRVARWLPSYHPTPSTHLLDLSEVLLPLCVHHRADSLPPTRRARTGHGFGDSPRDLRKSKRNERAGDLRQLAHPSVSVPPSLIPIQNELCPRGTLETRVDHSR